MAERRGDRSGVRDWVLREMNFPPLNQENHMYLLSLGHHLKSE